MLDIEGLHKTYSGGVQALKGISLHVDRGEFVAVLGSSGSGKSTLLRSLNRLVEPDSGSIALEGQAITGAASGPLRRLRRKMAMIFQEFNLIDRVSVLTNVLAGRLGETPVLWSCVNRFSKQDQAEALTHLRRMGLADKWNQRADRLSGGQRQRVGIARAMMQHPLLLLADEPVASLDPGAAQTILDLMRDINRQDGVTVLANLHAPDLARKYATRVVGLQEGRLIFDSPPDALDDAVLESLYGPGTPA